MQEVWDTEEYWVHETSAPPIIGNDWDVTATEEWVVGNEWDRRYGLVLCISSSDPKLTGC